MKTTANAFWLGISATLIFISGCASMQPIKQEELVVQKIFEVPKTREAIWFASMDWMVDEFRSAKDVIQFSDKEQGIIIGKGFTEVTYTIMPVDTYFTLKIEAKDNKARITIYDPYIKTKDFTVKIETKAGLEKYRLRISIIMLSYERALFKQQDSW